MVGVDDAVVEQEFPIDAPVELQCSPQGQVLLMPGERSVFDLSREWAARLADKRQVQREKTSPDALRGEIAERIGVDVAQAPAVSAQALVAEQPAPSTCKQQMWLLRPHRVPLLVGIERPAEPNGELVIYVSEEGVAAANSSEEPLKSYLHEGKTVAVVDLSGLVRRVRRRAAAIGRASCSARTFANIIWRISTANPSSACEWKTCWPRLICSPENSKRTKCISWLAAPPAYRPCTPPHFRPGSSPAPRCTKRWPVGTTLLLRPFRRTS